MTISTGKGADRVIFPLDERLGLQAGSLSPCLRRDVVWLSALLPYAPASAVLWRMGRHDLSTTTLWDHTQQVGTAWLEQEQRDYQPFLRKSVGIDGGMGNIRDEGWKELKVGAIGTLAPPWTLDEGQNARSHALHYTACLGGVDDFAPR